MSPRTIYRLEKFYYAYFKQINFFLKKKKLSHVRSIKIKRYTAIFQRV